MPPRREVSKYLTNSSTDRQVLKPVSAGALNKLTSHNRDEIAAFTTKVFNSLLLDFKAD